MKSALISCRTIIFAVGDIDVGFELISNAGHNLSVGSFVLDATIIPELLWTLCSDVAVNVAVQSLLQKSAVEFKDRSSWASGKTCTRVLMGGVRSVAVAIDWIAAPLGSPTTRPPPGV